MELSIHTEELAVEGRLSYGALTPLKYDIMGPFSLAPFMECCHSVWSMQHSVFGRIMLNGESYEFDHALGYWEGGTAAIHFRRNMSGPIASFGEVR